MARQTEPSVNNAMESVLQGMLSRSHVRSENTQTITGHPGLRPDILIEDPGRAPVVIEAEYMPGATVEAEAKSRLGLDVAASGRRIEAAIALLYPAEISDADDLPAALKQARLSYCVFTEERKGISRFPESGWLDGSPEDVADLVRLVSVPQRAVDDATTTLQEGISGAAKILDEMDTNRQAVTMDIARLLGMSNVPQTRRMACAIIANALIFHERIAGMHKGVDSIDLVCGDDIANPKGEVLSAWTDILKINYWAIFAVAKDILAHVPAAEAARILWRLRDTAQAVRSMGVENSHDLTGRIFQRLIADRKYLATFYTLPASAALLARLAVAKLQGVDWSDAEAIGRLRIADFACGTGALLSAVYEQIAAKHERAGGDPAALHRAMMEDVLYGCDVMPSAIHITGSTLSGVEPAAAFGSSRLYTMPYGRQPDGTVKIGSLELLQRSDVQTLFNTSDPALRTGSVGEETAAQVTVDVPDVSFDVTIMNPPFTRNTTNEGQYANTFNAAFAAFGASDQDQRDMGKRMDVLKTGTCYHGNAGIASAFAALAHKKLKPGGVLALVLPLAAAAGLSWQGFREMLAKEYTDITVLSIAASDNDHLSFSADTGMAECLVIARKCRPPESSDLRVHLASLSRRPSGFIQASEVSRTMATVSSVRRIEDGPYGATPLISGEEGIGEIISAPFSQSGEPCGAVRLSDASLAQTAFALSNAKLSLPGHASTIGINMTLLGILARTGLHHRDITGPRPRGPFDQTAPSPTATYPALWSHNAKNETRMVCEVDLQLVVRQGMEGKAQTLWETSSRSHLNLDFRFNSQPLGVAFTERESIGGRAWPTVKFEDRRFDHVFSVWSNSTFGFLMHWWHSNRQHAGRGTTTSRAAESLPVLDFRTLSDDQLAMGEMIFDEFRDKEFQPAYLADADPNRALLDRRVIRDLLGFDEETYTAVRRLAAKWCAEPSVHGGKPRPKDAKLVI